MGGGHARPGARDAVEANLPDIRRGAEWVWMTNVLVRRCLPTAEDAFHAGVEHCMVYAFPASWYVQHEQGRGVPVHVHLFVVAKQGVMRAARRDLYAAATGKPGYSVGVPPQIQARKPVVRAGGLVSPAYQYELDQDRVEACLDVPRLLAGLTQEELDATVIYYGLDGGGERTRAETAALLGCTESDVAYRLRRARATLRAAYGHGCD